MSQTILYVKKENVYTILKEYDEKNEELVDEVSLSSFTLNNISNDLLQVKNEENLEYNLYKRDNILIQDLFRAVANFLFDQPDVKVTDRFTSISQPISHILLFSKGTDSFIFYYKIPPILMGLQISTKELNSTFINTEDEYNKFNLVDKLVLYENNIIVTEKNELNYKKINANSYYIHLSKLIINKEVEHKASFFVEDKILLLVFKNNKTAKYINVYFDMLNISSYKIDQYTILDEINLKKLEIEQVENEEEQQEEEENEESEVRVTTKRMRNKRKIIKKGSVKKNNLYKEILKNVLEKNNENNKTKISDDFIKYLDIIVSREDTIEKINFVNLAFKVTDIIENANKMYESRYFNLSSDILLENYISDYNNKIMKNLLN